MIVRIYSLSTCFMCVAVLLIALPILSIGVIQMLSPESTLRAYTSERLSSNDNYWSSKYCHKKDEVKRPSEAVLTKERELELRKALNSERRDGAQLAQNTIMFIFSSIFFYVLHWRLYKRVEYA